MNNESLFTRVSNAFYYNKTIGALFWRTNARRGLSGKRAGTVGRIGYRVVCFEGKRYVESRLIWLLENGNLPVGMIDHISGDVADNRITNLRDVDCRTNQQNQRLARRDNKTGLLGAHYCKRTGLFASTIVVDGKKVWIGRFSTPELAHQAYLNKKREFHPGCTI